MTQEAPRTADPASAGLDAQTLRALAQKLRRGSVLATSEAGSGHPTTCLSAADVAAVLFFDEMRWDPKNPHARNADTFVLSKGHAAPLYWCALHEAGAISENPLTLRRSDSPLEGHPTPQSPWVRVATGSLGQGLSAAVGMALGKRMDTIAARVYCLLGDGEMAEGSVWEAAALAANQKLSNLCAIVDCNALGQSGGTLHNAEASAWAAKLDAFGWNAISVDGHSIDELRRAFAEARATLGRPTAIIARTEKGHGTWVAGKPGWHGKPFKKGEELARALAEIGDPQVKVEVRARLAAALPRVASDFTLDDPSLAPSYPEGAEVATREAYGTALVKLGKLSPDVVATDGDTKNSTFSEKFKDAFPARFVEAFIAEQNMVGMALGLAAEGKIPFASTFAAFFTRAYDFIRMAAYSAPKHLILVGSHCGVSIGEDGASQMALEDLAMMRPLFRTTVLYPSDAVSCERLVAAAAKQPGITYIRTSRPKTKILYGASETFPIGGSKMVRRSASDKATIVAAGVTVHEALKAADLLAKDGIAVRVIDAYSVKPIDASGLRQAHRETGRTITVEDHAAEGGLGEAVAAAIGAPVEILAVRKVPRSASPAECMAMQGIDAAGIVRQVKGGARA